MTKELDHMIERFPTHRGKIMELYKSSYNFRSLCEDYWISGEVLLNRRKTMTSESMQVKEYESICLLLEKEVMDYLAEKPLTQ
jgi:hypothetical protein